MNTEQIDSLVQRVQSLPDAAAREAALELAQAIMDLHAAGLERMMEILSEDETGGRFVEVLGADRLTSAILLLHDLHPLDLETRVLRALEQPDLRGVRLLSIEDGMIHVRIEAGHAGKAEIEAALAEAAPDAAGVAVESAGDFVPLVHLTGLTA